MTETILILAVMMGITAIGSFIFKKSENISAVLLLIAAFAGALTAGMGLRIREVVEGTFGYFDVMFAVVSGMIFVGILFDNGTFDHLLHQITSKCRNALPLSYLLLFFVAIPGILTGTATASVLTTGLLVGRFLIKNGMAKIHAVQFVITGALLGMLWPSMCVPAMMVTTSFYLGAYGGFSLALLVLVLPAFFAYGFIASKSMISIAANLQKQPKPKGSFLCVAPLLLVFLLLIAHDFFAPYVPFLGYPLIFAIGSVFAILQSFNKTNVLQSITKSIYQIAFVLAIICVTGSTLEVFNMTGVAGTLSTYLFLVDRRVLAICLMIVIVIFGFVMKGSWASVLSILSAVILYGLLDKTGGYLPYLSIAAALSIAYVLPANSTIAKTCFCELETTPKDKQLILSGVVLPAFFIFAFAVLFVLAGKGLAFLII